MEVIKKVVPLQSQTKNEVQQTQVWQDKFIEKIEGKYKKQVPRKYNLSRSVNSFIGIKVSGQAKDIILYNEEFDPGSG